MLQEYNRQSIINDIKNNPLGSWSYWITCLTHWDNIRHRSFAPEKIQLRMSRVMKGLNERMFGRKYKTEKKKVSHCAYTIENCPTTRRFHIHLLLSLPEEFTEIQKSKALSLFIIDYHNKFDMRDISFREVTEENIDSFAGYAIKSISEQFTSPYCMI